MLNLKAAVEREKAVQAIDVHRECTNCVVTFWVMNQFSHLQGVVQTFVIQLLFLGLLNLDLFPRIELPASWMRLTGKT